MLKIDERDRDKLWSLLEKCLLLEKKPQLRILLIAWCGDEWLSKHLRDAGHHIENVEISSVQLVKKLLKAGGKYIFLTLAESRFLDLLFPQFRFGWKMSLHTTDEDSWLTKQKLHTFVVVSEKEHSTAVLDIPMCEWMHDKDDELSKVLEKERKSRAKYSTDSNVSYSLEDLKLGANGNMSVLEPGRKIVFILPAASNFFYDCILLDSEEPPEWFINQYCVFIVPKERACDWLYTSDEGQWLLVKSSKAARLLMVFLDSSNSIYSMKHIQMDLSPFINQLAPGDIANGDPVKIPFRVASCVFMQATHCAQASCKKTVVVVGLGVGVLLMYLSKFSKKMEGLIK